MQIEFEFFKIKVTYERKNNTLINKESKLKNDYEHLLPKAGKLDLMHNKLQKYWIQNKGFYWEILKWIRKKKTKKKIENKFHELNNSDL